jgi:hypothetical protein
MTNASAVADLSAGLPADTADLHILFPGTNKRTGWIITCAGPGHPQSIALADELAREQLQKSAAIERAQVNGRKWKGDDDADPEAERKKTVTQVCRRIVTWTPVDFGDGAISFSHEAAVKLFMDPKKGAYFAQIVEFLVGERSFMTGSANG